MSAGFTHGHYVLGIEGLALLRAGALRRLDRMDDRVGDIHDVLKRLDEPPYSRRRDLPEYAVDAGYSAWAESYDDPGNDTVALEEPVVRRLLDKLPPGPVLDAACGTGRHAAYLAGEDEPGGPSEAPPPRGVDAAALASAAERARQQQARRGGRGRRGS